MPTESQRPEASPQLTDQTALACYLSAVVAIGHCMAEVCPPIGTMYRDRLLRLPRRLAFETTPQALQQSKDAVETDLAEYAGAAGAWVEAVVDHGARILEQLRETEDSLTAAADLQCAFIDDLAEHMEASAEVDDEADLRRSFLRYAAGLRAYSRRTKSEKLATIAEFQRRAHDIENWRGEATISIYADPESGLLNRAAAERRMQTEIAKQKPFCVIVIFWTEDSAEPGSPGSGQVAKELAERLAATIRPYDLIFRWSPNQLLTIFGAPEANIASRARQISGWLGDPLFPVEAAEIKTHTRVSVIEYEDGDTVATLSEKIEAQTREPAPK